MPEQTGQGGTGRDGTYWTKFSAIVGLVGVVVATIIGVAQCSASSSPGAAEPSTTSESAVATTTDSPAAGDGASSSEVATPSSTTSKAAKPSEPTPPVYSSGVIEMEDATGRIALFDPNWGTVSALAADIVADADLGLTASNGASFAVVPEPSYAACRDADYSVQALSWEELPSSTTVCIRSNDTRVGTVQVVWKENSGGSARDLTVRGVIWEPEH